VGIEKAAANNPGITIGVRFLNPPAALKDPFVPKNIWIKKLTQFCVNFNFMKKNGTTNPEGRIPQAQTGLTHNCPLPV
jgi:hypothetical protein